METKVRLTLLLCLVDSFDTRAQSPMGGGDRTPAQMLQSYLAATRAMENEKSSRFDPNKISVYVVECGQATRKRARAFHEELGLFDYDNTIPVILVFRKGKMKRVYTYNQSPGEGGRRLREYVETLSESAER